MCTHLWCPTSDDPVGIAMAWTKWAPWLSPSESGGTGVADDLVSEAPSWSKRHSICMLAFGPLDVLT